MLTVKDNRVFHGKRLVKECANHHDAVAYRHSVLVHLRQRAETMEPDDKPGLLAAAVDAALDAAALLIADNDPTTLPPWAQQVCALVIAADSAADELMQAMGIVDPDEEADA